MRGIHQNLNANQVDAIESRLDSYTAWIGQVGVARSAGRYLTVKKTIGSSEKLKVNTKIKSVCKSVMTYLLVIKQQL